MTPLGHQNWVPGLKPAQRTQLALNPQPSSDKAPAATTTCASVGTRFPRMRVTEGGVGCNVSCRCLRRHCLTVSSRCLHALAHRHCATAASHSLHRGNYRCRWPRRALATTLETHETARMSVARNPLRATPASRAASADGRAHGRSVLGAARTHVGDGDGPRHIAPRHVAC